MKKKKILALIVIILLVSGSIIWINFSDFEFGKYDNFQEALDKGIPYEVNDVIHTMQYDGVTIVLYTTYPDKDQMPNADFEVLNVAFLEGSDEDGWKNIGFDSWKHYENDNMTVYVEPLRVHDDKANVLHEFYVVFGKINNPDIATIETKAEKDLSFEEAEVISKNGRRYYLQIGQEHIVRGLSEDGEVIDRQGG
ncbi:hypothetical protein GLW05_18870 [Pontibacillus yanchengensis]|uniref:Uncharacterized protein n=1 Tax=Pontibacillus yanchengensis TaxID=462910 RepID=A0A6I5A5T3_9BACI|nr:hypothetical protein [Pontibacillus yanchengensis]MYL35643.1 hypothetical protein [Pontibacillus yanchengensis]